MVLAKQIARGIAKHVIKFGFELNFFDVIDALGIHGGAGAHGFIYCLVIDILHDFQIGPKGILRRFGDADKLVGDG